MGLFDWRSKEITRYIECRQCGATLDDENQPCPACGSSEVAIYRIED